MTIATQIDAQLVAEFAQELKELNQIRGNVHNILQGRARLTRELEKAKKTVRTVYWQKKQAAMYLTETDQLLQEVQEKGDQDLVAKVQQKRRKKGKSMLAAYERLNEAYDKVFDLQNRLIQMEEAALQIRMQRTEKEQSMSSLRFRILVGILGNLPATLMIHECTAKRTKRGFTLNCNLGRWHVSNDGQVTIIPALQPVAA